MYNVLVTADNTAWETDQRMTMMAERFREFSGEESDKMSLDDTDSLKLLEGVDSFLLYENGCCSLALMTQKFLG